MKYCLIKFIAKKIDFEEDIWSIIDYLHAILDSGQIIDCNNNIIINGDGVLCFATLPEETALSESNNSEQVSELLFKVRKSFEVNVEILGSVWYSHNEFCNCASSWYILAYDSDIGESPIICGNCEKPIPLYKLPFLDEDVYLWKTEYEAIITLWMYGFSDRFTYRQRNSPYSKLSRHGRAICKNLEKMTGVPSYYYLFYDSTKAIPKKCPSCDADWMLSNYDTKINYKCDNCRLVTIYKNS